MAAAYQERVWCAAHIQPQILPQGLAGGRCTIECDNNTPVVVSEREQIGATHFPEFHGAVIDCPFVVGRHQGLEAGQVG